VPSSGTRDSISVIAIVRARSSARWMLSMSPSSASPAVSTFLLPALLQLRQLRVTGPEHFTDR
jgi:hypothetical protein